MTSIKTRLLVGILGVIAFCTLLSAIATYFALKEEMDELFDENMRQIAHAIAVHNITEHSAFIDNADAQDIRRSLKGEEEFLIQVWHDAQISFSSTPAIAFPNQGAGGVMTVQYNHEKWRYYGLNAGEGWLVQVSQPIPIRHTVIWEVYWEQLIPTLIQLPFLMGLVWLVVGYGFAPLKRVSQSIETRGAYFLEKLPEEDNPAEVATVVQAINSLLDRLAHAMDAQRRFTADAAHELRTPLTAVRLELDILKRADNEAEKQESLDKLYSAVDRSTRLVQQLLEIARLEPDVIDKTRASVSLADVVRRITQEMQQIAQKKNITLSAESLPPITVEGHAHMLAILLSNLVGNALQYTQKGGQVSIAVTQDHGQVVLSVSDNGPGIVQDQRAHIFDRFYRILDERQAGVPGSGLGLSIVKSIAEAHHAQIRLRDGLGGKGISFQIIFS